jgi:colanic acid/amylovoran biosynthesis protein
MRILIETGNHSLNNLGDVAMLRVAVDRLANLWPGAELHVRTRQLAELQAQVPGAEGLSIPFPLWQRGLAGLLQRLPATARYGVPAGLEGALLAISSSLASRGVGQLVGEYDLVVMPGCGLIADPFWRPAISRLQTLEAAHNHDVPTVLLSQGVGPVTHPRMVEWARQVLPNTSLIGLRESRRAPALLSELGVKPDRVKIMGDDSLSLARPADHAGRLRTDLGWNLRPATYSGLLAGGLEPIRQLVEALSRMAQSRGSSLRLLSIHQDDAPWMSAIAARTQDSSQFVFHEHRLDQLLASVAACRVVVAGSYHAAVLALAHGAPAICLINSRYYRWKFEGLADRFPDGCRLVDLANQGWVSQVLSEVEAMWESAPEIGPMIVQRAHEQVEQSDNVYDQLPGIVGHT